MPKILLLMSIGKSQIHRHRCLNKIHRILSYIITIGTMQRKMRCFRQKWPNPEFGFVPTWNKNLKYQQLCDKIELQFSRNMPKVCRVAGSPGSLEGSLPQHRWWSGELNLPTPKTSHTSDAGKQWCQISLPTNQDSCGGWGSRAPGVTVVHLEGCPSAWQPRPTNSHVGSWWILCLGSTIT